MRVLRDNCVGHNYLWFYRDANEACLNSANWGEVETYAKAAEDYTRNEPLPWMRMIIARGRAIAAANESGASGPCVEVLSSLRDETRTVGFRSILPVIDSIMEQVR